MQAHSLKLTLDFSGELCARNVRALGAMTRREVETFLASSAHAANGIVFVRASRPKPEKVKRTPRHQLRRENRWR